VTQFNWSLEFQRQHFTQKSEKLAKKTGKTLKTIDINMNRRQPRFLSELC
jgi:hypothetical protein